MKIKTYFFNVIDVAIILFALSIFFGFLFAERNQEIILLFDKAHSAEITVNISDGALKSSDFTVGEKVYLDESGKSIGKIISAVNIKEKKYYPINDSLVIEYGDNIVGVQLKVQTKVKINDSGTYINGSHVVSPGKRVKINTKNQPAFGGVIDDVSIK